MLSGGGVSFSVRVQPRAEGRCSVYHLYPFFINQRETGVNHDDMIRGLEARMGQIERAVRQLEE